jgi:hypothetical protein
MIMNVAGTVGLEPTPFRLTGGRSAIELHARNLVDRDGVAPPSAGLQPAALLPKLPIRLVERVGVEPTKPLGRLVYSQGFSPMKASPKLGLTVSIELTTCCLQDSCSAKLSYISNIVGAGASAHASV